MTVKAQKAYMVSVPPRSSGAEIHVAIQAIHGRQGEIRLMAGSLEFVTPREICGLRALLDHAAAHADRVILDCPVSRDVHAYLARVDFYDALPPNVELSRRPPILQRRDRRRSLLELVRLQTSDDVEHLMDRLWEVAKAQFGPGAVAKACTTAVGAATENVIDHAESPIGALVAAQRYRTTGLELAVVDLGHGIPMTLARNPDHRGLTDLDALELSLKDGVSSAREPGRGAGLTELVMAAGRAGQSTLRLGSGRAHLTLSWENGHYERQPSVPAYVICGTWISLRLEN